MSKKKFFSLCVCVCVLPKARKEKSHCSTAAVSSLLRNGMFSGANSIFMPAIRRLGSARRSATCRCLSRSLWVWLWTQRLSPLDFSPRTEVRLSVCLCTSQSLSLCLCGCVDKLCRVCLKLNSCPPHHSTNKHAAPPPSLGAHAPRTCPLTGESEAVSKYCGGRAWTQSAFTVRNC